MWQFIKLLKGRELAFLAASLIFTFIQVWLDLEIPGYMAKLTQYVGGGEKVLDFTPIWQTGRMMLVCSLGSLIAATCMRFFIVKTGVTFAANLRRAIFKKITRLGLDTVRQFSTSSLMVRTTGDVRQVYMLIGRGLSTILRAGLTAAWAIAKIAGQNRAWTGLTAAAVILLMLDIFISLMIVAPRFKIIQKMLDQLNRVTRENLTGLKVVRAFNAERYEEEKFAKINAMFTKTRLGLQQILASISPMIFFVLNAITLAIYFAGAYLIAGAENKLPLFGQMLVFSTYASHIIIAFLMLASVFMLWPRAQVSAGRIMELLNATENFVDGKRNFENRDTESSTKDDRGSLERIFTAAENRDEAGRIRPKRGLKLEFKNVSFAYPKDKEMSLKDISFTIEAGKTLAIVGSTGAGKTSLVNLIPRLYDPSCGQVLINDIDIKAYSVETLRAQIGYVPQKAILFNGSVRANIAYGKKTAKSEQISLAKIQAAATVAGARDFIEALPKQYDAQVAQGGENFSGGQKQRLAIARAVARDPELYIFDDAFSALDYATDAKVRHALSSYAKGATKLIVAQRIGTIMHADRIVVLDKGRMVGIGTHAELMQKCKLYQQLAASQLDAEEMYV